MKIEIEIKFEPFNGEYNANIKIGRDNNTYLAYLASDTLENLLDCIKDVVVENVEE